MAGPCNWFRHEDDPEDLLLENQALMKDINNLLQASTPARDIALEKHLDKDLTRVVYRSNLIESAGSNFDITSKFCNKVFQKEPITEEITEGGVRGVVRHARALSFIINEMVVLEKPLTYKVDAFGGDKYT